MTVGFLPNFSWNKTVESKFYPLIGLQSEEGLHLNNQEGIIDHFSRTRDCYAVSLAGKSELKMTKEINLELLQKPLAAPVFDNEEEMMTKLKAMGMPPQMLVDLLDAQKKTMFDMTQRQSIVEDARKWWVLQKKRNRQN